MAGSAGFPAGLQLGLSTQEPGWEDPLLGRIPWAKGQHGMSVEKPQGARAEVTGHRASVTQGPEAGGPQEGAVPPSAGRSGSLVKGGAEGEGPGAQRWGLRAS